MYKCEEQSDMFQQWVTPENEDSTSCYKRKRGSNNDCVYQRKQNSKGCHQSPEDSCQTTVTRETECLDLF